jgi:hypothetical protein
MEPSFPLYPSEKNTAAVKLIQTQLRQQGFKRIAIDGIFGKFTYTALRAFQANHCDGNGNPLPVDGIVRHETWQALIAEHPTINPVPSPLQQQALRYAKQELCVLESPLGSNKGKEIEMYQKSVLIPPGSPWCAAFVYWCYAKAALEICTINPLPRTAHCLTHWTQSQGHRIPASAFASPSPFGGRGPAWGHLIKPGSIFIINHGKGKGHTGIVANVFDNCILTIEGNTNQNHSREGIGVFQLTRKIDEINMGFINYG